MARLFRWQRIHDDETRVAYDVYFATPNDPEQPDAVFVVDKAMANALDWETGEKDPILVISEKSPGLGRLAGAKVLANWRATGEWMPGGLHQS